MESFIVYASCVNGLNSIWWWRLFETVESSGTGEGVDLEFYDYESAAVSQVSRGQAEF